MAVEQTPKPRTVPVAVLRWQGLEVNALTASVGLPTVEVALRTCPQLSLPDGGTHVFILDPFDLLANKLAVGRAKEARRENTAAI